MKGIWPIQCAFEPAIGEYLHKVTNIDHKCTGCCMYRHPHDSISTNLQTNDAAFVYDCEQWQSVWGARPITLPGSGHTGHEFNWRGVWGLLAAHFGFQPLRSSGLKPNDLSISSINFSVNIFVSFWLFYIYFGAARAKCFLWLSQIYCAHINLEN